MAKDPAVLFYYQDFLVGTEFMSDEEVGKYIRILCHQADKGALTKKQVLSICKASAIPDCIQEKLKINSDDLYYNTRMLEEKEKRSKFTESRRNNAKSKVAYAKHMENENENINEINNDLKKDSETIKDSQPTVETLAEDDEEIEGVKYFFGIFNINLDGSSEDLRKTWRRWVNRNYIRGKPIDKITATSQIKYLRTVEGGTAKIIEKINLSITNGWNGLNYESGNNGKSEQKSSGATNDFLANLCTDRAVREYQNKPD